MCSQQRAANKEQPTQTQWWLPNVSAPSLASHAPLPLPMPWPAEEGREGGSNNEWLNLSIHPPSPPLPSSAGHGMGRGSGAWEAWEAETWQQALCLCWLFGCSLLAAHVDGAYYLKCCKPWVKATRSVSLRESFCTLWGGNHITRCEQLRTRKLAQQTVCYYFSSMGLSSIL